MSEQIVSAGLRPCGNPPYVKRSKYHATPLDYGPWRASQALCKTSGTQSVKKADNQNRRGRAFFTKPRGRFQSRAALSSGAAETLLRPTSASEWTPYDGGSRRIRLSNRKGRISCRDFP